MCAENLHRILAWNQVACGSDETARPLDYSLGRSHPRGFGAFPEFFRVLRENGVTIGEIVRRFTSLPAEIFRLPLRGVLRPGCFADLTVFDPVRFSSSADFCHPHRPADGIHMVFVNGKVAFADGAVIARHGVFLKPARVNQN
jgi:N-acyl-D-aspartate/D-glutamate deacylase